MKFYISFLLVFICSVDVWGMFTNQLNVDLHKLEEDCSKVSGVSFADIEDARKSKSIPDNAEMKIFAKCMMNKFNVIDDNGVVNDDVRSYKIPDDTNQIYKVSEDCKTKTAADAAGNPREIMNCFLKNGQIVLAIVARPVY